MWHDGQFFDFEQVKYVAMDENEQSDRVWNPYQSVQATTRRDGHLVENWLNRIQPIVTQYVSEETDIKCAYFDHCNTCHQHRRDHYARKKIRIADEFDFAKDIDHTDVTKCVIAGRVHGHKISVNINWTDSD